MNARPVRVLLLAAAAVAATATFVFPAAAGPECANVRERRDEWVGVHLPAGVRATSVAETADDPCVLAVAAGGPQVYVSTTGGREWAQHAMPHDVVRVFGDALVRHTLLAAYRGGGLAISHDEGATFTDVSLTPGAGEAVYVTGNPADQQTVYLLVDTAVAGAAAAGALPSLYVSRDSGATFQPLPGSAGIRATVVAVDPAAPLNLWVNDTSALATKSTALWVSVNGGQSFQPPPQPVTEPVTDLAFGAVADGPSLLAAASAQSGVLTTTDGGKTWAHRQLSSERVTSADPAHGVRMEPARGDVVMAVSDLGAWRSTDGGRRFSRTGGPCGARSLSRDDGNPGTFLLLCGDGTVRRYQSSGADIATAKPEESDTAEPNDPGGTGSGTGVPTLLPVLATLQLPVNDGSSGSLAFDGESLYYGPPPDIGLGGFSTSVIHRIRARDGVALPDIPVPFPVSQMSYDGKRHVLYLQVTDGGEGAHMAQLDLRSLKITSMFQLPGFTGVHSLYSYDATIDRFVTAPEEGTTVFQVNRRGVITSRCTMSTSAAQDSTAASMTAAGFGGSGYWQSEDDTTVWHIGPRCEPLAEYIHRRFAESQAENDALVCDTITFDQPAIWIRDSDNATVYAYGVPKAYCPLATQVALTPPREVHRGDPVTLCARLTTRGGTAPLPALPLTFTVGGVGAGSATTDVTGTACVPYPTTGPALSPDVNDVEHRAVRAAFFGTHSYTPSFDDATLALRDTPVALPKPPPLPAVVPVPVPPLPPHLPIPQPLPQPNPAPQAQVEAQAQGQAQAQAQAQPNLVAVPQVQEQVQVATNEAGREHNMTRYRPRRRPYAPGPTAGFAAVATAIVAAAAYRTQVVARKIDPRGGSR